ncbi:MAG: AraC family transcriptional regulator [Kiritimatiellia bacterium]
MHSARATQLPPPARWVWVNGFEPTPASESRHSPHRQWMRSHTEKHAFREVMLVLEGAGSYGCDGHLYRLEPGVVIMFDTGTPHDRNYSPYQPPCRHLWLRLISPRKIMGGEAVVNRRRSRGAKGTPAAGYYRRHFLLQGAFADCLTMSWDACSAGDHTPFAVERLKAATAAALLEVLLRDAGLEDEKTRSDQGKIVVAEVGAYIAGHLGEDLSLGTLARLAGYEPHYLERLLLRHTGEPLRRHVNRLRLERAKILLGDGMTANGVAEALGFGSVSYFCRFFAQATGLPPLHWQARANHDEDKKRQ